MHHFTTVFCRCWLHENVVITLIPLFCVLSSRFAPLVLSLYPSLCLTLVPLLSCTNFSPTQKCQKRKTVYLTPSARAMFCLVLAPLLTGSHARKEAGVGAGSGKVNSNSISLTVQPSAVKPWQIYLRSARQEWRLIQKEIERDS